MAKEKKVELLEKQNIINGKELLQNYLLEEFDLEIGNLQAEIFLEFISAKLGPYYFNKGVSSSMACLNEKVEDLYLLMLDEE